LTKQNFPRTFVAGWFMQFTTFRYLSSDHIARNSEPKWVVLTSVMLQYTCQPVNKASVWLARLLKPKL